MVKQRKKIYQRSRYAASRTNEVKFERALARVAREAAKIVARYTKDVTKIDFAGLHAALDAYAKKVEPWARTQSTRLLNETLKRVQNDKSYRDIAARIGKKLSKDIFESDIGLLAFALQVDQVNLITSIPVDAGERVQQLAAKGVITGERAEVLAKQISQTMDICENRAKLIARTETARANTMINLARAKSVGSTQYVWRNSGDHAVRESHEWLKGKRLDGQIFSWDDPPTLDDGMTGHPGTFPNCRCYAEPILPNI